MQEKLLIYLFLANLNQTPQRMGGHSHLEFRFGLNAAKLKDVVTVQLQCPAVNCRSTHTVSASLLPIPACWLLASLTDLTNCVDKSNGRLFISQIFIFRL